MTVKDVCDLQRTAAGLHSGAGLPRRQRCEPVERAGHVADRGVGDARVKGRGVQPIARGQ